MFRRKVLVSGVSLVLTAFMLVGLISPVALCQSNGINAETADSVIDKLLIFINSAAEIIGRGLVKLVDMIAGVDVSELEIPLGYLGVLTASLVVFGALKAAQKIIWFILFMGWGLIIVRIVLEALEKLPAE